jgi:hypothetical protein
LTILGQAGNNYQDAHSTDSHGHVRVAVAETRVDIADPVAELEEAPALIVAVPEVPETHCASPFWSTVAILGSSDDQLPEYGATNGTGTAEGEGGLLKVPVTTNCTWPPAKFCASAFAGVNAIEVRTRLLVEEEPQAIPKVTNNAANETAEQRTAVFLLMINSGRVATLSHLSEVDRNVLPDFRGFARTQP